MLECEKCGKEFKYKSKLKEHLNRKTPCNSVHPQNTNVHDEEEPKHTCTICKKSFASRKGKYNHRKNVTCKFIESAEDKILRLEKENEKLRNRPIQTINNINITNNSLNQFNIHYDQEKRCLTSSDPKAPAKELLCFDGFKKETLDTNLLMNISEINLIINNLRDSNLKNYDILWNFLFRNKNIKRLHMFMMQKNNNTTHIDVFHNGNKESMRKDILYDTVAQYMSQYMINLSFKNHDIIELITNDDNCKKSFYQTIRQHSETFNYFSRNGIKDNDEKI